MAELEPCLRKKLGLSNQKTKLGEAIRYTSSRTSRQRLDAVRPGRLPRRPFSTNNCHRSLRRSWKSVSQTASCSGLATKSMIYHYVCVCESPSIYGVRTPLRFLFRYSKLVSFDLQGEIVAVGPVLR
jgi:hypothetical protein